MGPRHLGQARSHTSVSILASKSCCIFSAGVLSPVLRQSGIGLYGFDSLGECAACCLVPMDLVAHKRAFLKHLDSRNTAALESRRECFASGPSMPTLLHSTFQRKLVSTFCRRWFLDVSAYQSPSTEARTSGPQKNPAVHGRERPRPSAWRLDQREETSLAT